MFKCFSAFKIKLTKGVVRYEKKNDCGIVDGGSVFINDVLQQYKFFGKDRIDRLFINMQGQKWGLFGIVPACILGIVSPLCMYGTIPIAASFSKKGMRDDWLAAFMMSSILFNPQLIIYSAALGTTVLTIRILSCFFCGIAAGLLVYFFTGEKHFLIFPALKKLKPEIPIQTLSFA